MKKSLLKRVYADCLGGTVKTESSVKDVGKF